MAPFLISFFKALRSQLHPRMLFLTLLPFLVGGALWVFLIWWAWEPSVNALQQWLGSFRPLTWLGRVLQQVSWFQWSFQWEKFLAPILLSLLMLPLLVMTVVTITGLIAAPLAARQVASHYYPQFKPRPGWRFFSSVWHSLLVTLVFFFSWLVLLPLWLIPPLGVILPVILWGWLTYRILFFEVLSDYASVEEIRILALKHRWSLWCLGMVLALLAALPALLWIGGMALFVFAPLAALLMLWLYVLILVYSALVFAHYGFFLLTQYRRQTFEENAL